MITVVVVVYNSLVPTRIRSVRLSRLPTVKP
jgi:hypothetical protein